MKTLTSRLSLIALTAATALAVIACPVAAREDKDDDRDLTPAWQSTPGNRSMKLAFKSMNGSRVEEGDTVRFQMRANRDGYVHMYVVSASGRVQLWMENIAISADEKLTYPSSNDVKITARPPFGKDRIVAILTQNKMDGFLGRIATRRPVDLDMSESEFRKDVEAMMADVPKSRWTWSTLTVSLKR